MKRRQLLLAGLGLALPGTWVFGSTALKAEAGDASAREWVRSFEALGEKLLFRLG